MPLQPQALEDVKSVLRKSIAEGVQKDGITHRGTGKRAVCTDTKQSDISHFSGTCTRIYLKNNLMVKALCW